MTACTCVHARSHHDREGKCGVFGCPCPSTEAPLAAMPGARPRFLTPQEVADRYTCGLDWVYHCEALKPYKRKIGGKLRFLESDLVKFENDRDGARYGVTKEFLMRRRHEYEQEHPKETILKFDFKPKVAK